MATNNIALMASDMTVTQTDSAPSWISAAAIDATSRNGKNIDAPCGEKTGSGNDKSPDDQGGEGGF